MYQPSALTSTFSSVPRLQGDLLYLDIVTLEGRSFCVSAHTRGFLVNRSGGNGRALDPRPAEPRMEASTLVGLLRQISPKFSAGEGGAGQSSRVRCSAGWHCVVCRSA